MSKALEIWEEDLSTKSSNTRYLYRRWFRKFLERYNLTAEELYRIRREDWKSEDPRDRQNVERKVKVLMSEMMEEGYAVASSRQVAKAVTSFLESQGMPLKMRVKDLPKGFSNGQRLALVDHIKTMWDFSPTENKVKNRAMLCFLKDSGIRVSDLIALNVGDYFEAKKVKVNNGIFAVFDALETEKTKAPAYIHVGPETIEALNEYLEERGSPEPREPLFLNREGERFKQSALSQVFMRLGRQTNTKGVSAHSLRKFHTTMLESTGMPVNWIKKLQGKQIRGSMRPYSHPEETGELTQFYIDGYTKLRVFGEQASVQKLKEQADEVEKLRKRIQELKDEKREAEEITVRLENMVKNLINRVEKLEKK